MRPCDKQYLNAYVSLNTAEAKLQAASLVLIQHFVEDEVIIIQGVEEPVERITSALGHCWTRIQRKIDKHPLTAFLQAEVTDPRNKGKRV